MPAVSVASRQLMQVRCAAVHSAADVDEKEASAKVKSDRLEGLLIVCTAHCLYVTIAIPVL